MSSAFPSKSTSFEYNTLFADYPFEQHIFLSDVQKMPLHIGKGIEWADRAVLHPELSVIS